MGVSRALFSIYRIFKNWTKLSRTIPVNLRWLFSPLELAVPPPDEREATLLYPEAGRRKHIVLWCQSPALEDELPGRGRGGQTPASSKSCLPSASCSIRRLLTDWWVVTWDAWKHGRKSITRKLITRCFCVFERQKTHFTAFLQQAAKSYNEELYSAP